MAQLSCSSLCTEVQTLCGRGDGDTVLITSTRITRWLNDAQRIIAEEVPGLLALDINRCTTAVVCVTDKIAYNLKEWTSTFADTTTANHIAHIYGLYVMDGQDSYRLNFRPADEFDEYVIDPTSTDHSPSQPEWFTRRGDTLYLFPLTDSTWSERKLRLVGSLYPLDFTVGSACASVLDKADDGLIYYGVAKAWEAIGGDKGKLDYQTWMQRFSAWLTEYQSWNNRMTEWQSNLYGAVEA